MISQPCGTRMLPDAVQRFNSQRSDMGVGGDSQGSYEHMATNSDVGSSAPFQSHQSNHEAESSVMPPAGSSAQGQGLESVLSFINAHKVQQRTLASMAGPGSVKSSASSSHSSRDIKWIQPSGPRRPGEGVENEEQGIISAEQPTARVVVLRITLLAAGFIIGPSGSTVRDIMRVSGCDIKSWTEQPGAKAKRPCRVFVLEGEEPDILSCLTIITAAIDRYKELCEGRCCGQTVGRVQRVMGVEFSYQPPPKNIVPFAAALKGHVQRPLRLPSSTFDAILQQQQQQPPQGFMLAGNGSGNMAPYFGPYSSLLVPPASPTMLPYPAMYGLAMPPSQSLPTAHVTGDGDYGGSTMMCGYDYSHVLGLGNAGNLSATETPTAPPGGIYLYPGSPMPDASGGGPPGSPSTGWVTGAGPGMMILPGMMMPSSPVRYHGMPPAAGSVPMGVDPMGMQTPFLGCTPMTPELSWQMGMQGGGGGGGSGGGSGGGLQSNSGSNAASAKMSVDASNSTPSAGHSDVPSGAAGGSSLGSYDFMAHQMYGQPMMTWYGNSPAGMVCSPGPAPRGSPPSPYSHMMTMMPFYKPDHAGVSSGRSHSGMHPGTSSRLNPRAAPWGQPSHGKEHPRDSQRQQHQHQLQPAMSAPAAAAAYQPHSTYERQAEQQVQQQQQQQPDQASDATVDQSIPQSVTQSGSAIDSNKENQGLGALAPPDSPGESGTFLAKTPKRPSFPRVTHSRSGGAGAYSSWLPGPHNPDRNNMSTPPRSYDLGIPSSHGSCSADHTRGPEGVSRDLASSAPGTAMVSPADPLISPSRFSQHRMQQRARVSGSSSTRHRQPNFSAAAESPAEFGSTHLLYHSTSHPQLPVSSPDVPPPCSDGAAHDSAVDTRANHVAGAAVNSDTGHYSAASL